jgi:DNA-binding GntR family transcriptional regulator
MREIYELRVAIEGLAAFLAADRAGAADLDALQDLLDAMDAEPVDHEAANLKLLNERFHRKIAEIAGNSLLPRQMDEIWSRVSLARTDNWSTTGRGETSRLEHHAIFHAIRDGAADEARRLAEAHVRAAWADVEPFLAK